MKLLIQRWLACVALLCGVAAHAGDAPIPVYDAIVVHMYPHDPEAFTQGLLYHDGFLYESTGLHGRSSIRKVKLETGRVLQKRDLGAQYFGEGLALWKNQLINITWQSGTGFVFDLGSFTQRRQFRYSGEGWGLTDNGRELIMSDGTATLRVLEPTTQRELRRISVTANGRPVPQINELEWVGGELFANIWQTDVIARIDLATGKVIGWIDLTGLLQSTGQGSGARSDVLNGIAYDAKGKRLFVTGKLWPTLFEIRLVARKTGS